MTEPSPPLFPDRAARAKAQWDKEIPGLDLGPMVLLGRLAEAAPLMINTYLAPEYARVGLKPGEFDVLATLVRSGPPYKLTPTELYRSTITSSGGMTARLDRLEKAGHIERHAHPDDRRALMICLTDRGLTLIRSMMPRYVDMLHQAVSGLSGEDQKQLSELLGKLIQTTLEPQ